MDNEELENLLNNLSGVKKNEIWMNTILGIMASQGFKPAEIQILQIEIQTLIQNNIMEKYVLLFDFYEDEKLDEIKDFLKDIKKQIIDFSDKLLDKGE